MCEPGSLSIQIWRENEIFCLLEIFRVCGEMLKKVAPTMETPFPWQHWIKSHFSFFCLWMTDCWGLSLLRFLLFSSVLQRCNVIGFHRRAAHVYDASVTTNNDRRSSSSRRVSQVFEQLELKIFALNMWKQYTRYTRPLTRPPRTFFSLLSLIENSLKHYRKKLGWRILVPPTQPSAPAIHSSGIMSSSCPLADISRSLIFFYFI